MNVFKYKNDFVLENGKKLPGIEIGYHTHGELNTAKDNVVWICHALTANSDPTDWWKGLIGSGCLINPEKYFIIASNILGSCYGSTGPLSINPITGEPY